MLDISADELADIKRVQDALNAKYAFRPCARYDLPAWVAMKDDIVHMMGEIGFEVEVHPDFVGNDMHPKVDIVGRTDKSLQRVIDAEGVDVEKRGWEARRESSADLEAQGLDTGLLLR